MTNVSTTIDAEMSPEDWARQAQKVREALRALPPARASTTSSLSRAGRVAQKAGTPAPQMR